MEREIIVRDLRLFPKRLLSYCCYQLSKLFPRNPNKWIFGAHFGFKDNSKFLLYDVLDHHSEIRAIWICRHKVDIPKLEQQKIEYYYWPSIKALYHCLTAKVWICTQNTLDINNFTSGGAYYVNLNHGVGVKKCYWLRPDFMERNWGRKVQKLEHSWWFRILTHPVYFRVPDLCLVTSRFQAETFFAPMFRIPLSKCVYSNFPRNNLLTCEKEKVIALARKYEPETTLQLIDKSARYRKVYIYMPTWRNDMHDFIESAKIDFQRLNEVLRQGNDLLILKLHPYTRLDISKVNGLSNIVCFPAQSDVYYILPFTDCLITDYSSIYSDYSLMNKEVILFVFDLDDYLCKCTELEDYDKYYPGMRANDFEELVDMIANNKDCHVGKEDREFILKTYWGNIGEGVNFVEEIKNRIGLKE